MREVACLSEMMLFVPVLDYACPICICATCTHASKLQVVDHRDLEFAIIHFFILVTNKFTRIWITNFPPSTPEHGPIV